MVTSAFVYLSHNFSAFYLNVLPKLLQRGDEDWNIPFCTIFTLESVQAKEWVLHFQSLKYIADFEVGKLCSPGTCVAE